MKSNWIRRTALFLTGQTITLLGSSIVQFSISWHITLSTKSGLMVTLATLCGFLPQVLISLFAGVWADRFDRKRLIVLADSVIAVCTAVLAVLFTMGYQDIWLLFLISVIRSAGAGVQTPAVSAFLTELAPPDKLMRVNGINASIQSIMLLLSPAAAGTLYGSVGLGATFWVDVVTAIIGISLLLILKTVPRETAESEPGRFFQDMLEGIRYVITTKWLRQLLLFYLIYMLMFGPVAFLTPLMVARSFGEESWRLMVHEMVFSGGCIVGGVVVGVLGNRIRNKVHMVLMASAAFGLATLILGFSPNFWFFLGVVAPMGVTVPFINTGAMTVLQTRIEPEKLGRVFGLTSIIGSGAMPLSMVVFGPLADVMQVQHQLIITGAAMACIALGMSRFREMSAAGEPQIQPDAVSE